MKASTIFIARTNENERKPILDSENELKIKDKFTLDKSRKLGYCNSYLRLKRFYKRKRDCTIPLKLQLPRS